MIGAKEISKIFNSGISSISEVNIYINSKIKKRAEKKHRNKRPKLYL
jgi:hypothetical protein